jgi:hypothetical protein
MSARRIVRRAMLLGAVCLLGASLTACSPADPTAIRINADGSVSFVACDDISDVKYVNSVTQVRSGFPARIDESQTVEMTPPDSFDEVVAGQVYTFVPGTDDWNRAYIYVSDRDGGGLTAIMEGTDYEVGTWEWSNSRATCEVEE